MKSDTHVRCESWKFASAERKPKVEGGGRQQRGWWEAMLVPFIQKGRQKRKKREEGGSGGGQGKGSEGLIEEQRSGTRLTLRPCRMHKSGTRDKKSSQKHDTSKRAHKRKKKQKQNKTNALHLNSSGWSWWPVINMKLRFGVFVTPQKQV